MANLKTNISGGGAELQIGDITQEDKSGDSNFVLCNGQVLSTENYPLLDGKLRLAVNTSSQVDVTLASKEKLLGFIGNKLIALKIASDSNLYLAYSTNMGASFTLTSYKCSVAERFFFDNDTYYMLGSNASLGTANTSLYTTTDGVNWTITTTSGITSFVSGNYPIIGAVIGKFNNLFIAPTATYPLGQSRFAEIYTSTNGISWTQRLHTGNLKYDTDLAININNTVCAVNQSATTYYTSIDGITWTARTAPTTWKGECFEGKLYCGTVYQSTDFINWVQLTGTIFEYADYRYGVFQNGYGGLYIGNNLQDNLYLGYNRKYSTTSEMLIFDLVGLHAWNSISGTTKTFKLGYLVPNYKTPAYMKIS